LKWDTLLNEKYISAEFAADNHAIYLTTNSRSASDSSRYSKYILHDWFGNFSRGPIHRYIWHYLDSEESVEMNYDFNILQISNEDKYVVTSLPNSETVRLIGVSGIQLINFKAECVDFSLDDKFIYFSEDKLIHKILLDEREIKKLVFEDEIFGSGKSDKKDWISY
jgi:hypothetical protein